MTDIHSNIEMSSKEMLAYRKKIEDDNPGCTVTYLDINVQAVQQCETARGGRPREAYWSVKTHGLLRH